MSIQWVTFDPQKELFRKKISKIFFFLFSSENPTGCLFEEKQTKKKWVIFDP
jgi:hypothetical protein